MRLLALLPVLIAVPALAQVEAPGPKPTKVVARSGRLVTARTADGGTRSFNCKRPENAKRAVCRGKR